MIVFPHSFGGQNLKSSCAQGPVPFKDTGEAFLASSSFRWLQGFLCLELYNSSLCLLIAICPVCLWVSNVPLSLSYKDTCHWIRPTINSGWPCLRSPHLITAAKTLALNEIKHTVSNLDIPFVEWQFKPLYSLILLILPKSCAHHFHFYPIE